MSVLTSTVPLVRAAFKARVVALNLVSTEGVAVQVAVGLTRVTEREAVILGEVRSDSDQEWARLGQGTRKEHYVLENFVVVQKPGDDATAASERAWAILAAIETDLRSSKQATTLGLTAFGVTDAGIVNPVDQFGSNDEGYACQITFGLRVNGLLVGGTA